MATVGYTKNTPSGSPTSVTWSRSCAIGNTLVLLVQHMGTNQCTVADNSGGTNVWTLVADSFTASTPATSERRIDMWMCVPTVAVTSITATSVGLTATFWVLQAKDYAGPLAVRSSNKWFGGAGPQAGVAATAGDQLVTGCAYAATTAGVDQVTVAGWTLDGFNNISNVQSDMFEQTAATTATITPSFTISATIGVVTAALRTAGNTPPTASAGTTQTVAVNTLVTLAGSSSDADGFIASVAWSQLSGPTVTLSSTTINTPTFTPTVPGVVVLQYAATDNLGATTTASVTINVNSTSARPNATFSNAGGYTNVGGAASLEAALADESDTTLIQSVAGPAGAVYIASISPLSNGTITVKHRSKQDISFPVVTRVSEVLQAPANTSIASHSDNLTTTWTDYSWTLTSGQAAAITDFNSLRVRITDTQN